MTRALILLLVLAGCASRAPSPLTPGEQACAAQADGDPAVKQQLAIAAGNPEYQFRYGDVMRQVRQDAITRCLRARGLAPKGGVERPR